MSLRSSEPATFLMADAKSPAFGFAGVPNKRDPNVIDFRLPAGWTPRAARQYEEAIKSVLGANQQCWFTAREIAEHYPHLCRVRDADYAIRIALSRSVKLSMPDEWRTVEEIGLNFLFVQTKPHRVEYALPGYRRWSCARGGSCGRGDSICPEQKGKVNTDSRRTPHVQEGCPEPS